MELRIQTGICVLYVNDPDFGKLRGSGKERDTLVGNLKTTQDIDKEEDNIGHR